MTIAYSYSTSPFGKYLIASSQKGITHLFFFDGVASTVEKELQESCAGMNVVKEKTMLHKKVEKYFAGKMKNKPTFKFDLKGTPFQIAVWQALFSISYGKTVSYKELARLIKKPKAIRAVGTALGANTLGFFIPCHRVVKADGKIGDYRWGSARKKMMLEWENSK